MTQLLECEVPTMFFISKRAFNNAVDKAICEAQRKEMMEMRGYDHGNKLAELEERVGRLEHVLLRAKRKAAKVC